MAEKRWTPDRARATGRWLGWSAAALGLTAAVMSFAGFAVFAVPLLLIAHVCHVEAAEQRGWQLGYLAHGRQAKRAEETPGGGRRG